MADKIIKVRINVEKINKGFLYKGEKGTYLDVTVLYNEEQDQYGSNGMVVQDVPADIYKKEKDLPKNQKTQGEILGNCKDWATQARDTESIPGGGKKEVKKDDTPPAPADTSFADDLPF